MRACMVAYTFYETDNRVRRYAEGLVRRGDDVEAIALRLDGQPAFEIIKGVRVFRIQKRVLDERSPASHLWKLVLFFLRSAWFLTLRHMRAPYNLIHVHSVPDFQVFATLIPRLLGAKVILDIHDIVPEFYASKFRVGESSLAFRMLLLMERLSAAYSDHVIIANHLWHTRLCQRSVRPAKCTAIINYPDLAIFTRRPRCQTATGDFVMCYPGSLNWHQGLDIAVRAMALLRDKAPNLRFLIIGEGPDRKKLAAMVKEHHLEGRVIMNGIVPMEKVAETMASVDLGVVPKRRDSFGNEAFSTKIMEFMAMGVPVIASNTRIDQYYFNGDVVQFFESENTEDLAAKILDLMRDPARYNSLREHGLEFIQQNNWDVKKGEYLDLVDPLAERPRRRRHQRPSSEPLRDCSGRSAAAGVSQLPGIDTSVDAANKSVHATSGCENPSGKPATRAEARGVLADYYGCAAIADGFAPPADLDGRQGYFRFGRHAVCYGRLSSGVPAARPEDASVGAMEAIRADGPAIRLPFDAGEVIDSLRMERYARGEPAGRPARHEAIRQAYYLMRPMLPVPIRTFLQKQHFRGWEGLRFPAWPVDATVERVHKELLALTLRASGAAEIPFIWFWPDGVSSCAIMTHDVEASAGMDACGRLMDIDEAFGIRSSFELVPERRYTLRPEVLGEVRERGFEINIHDLNHDGNLFADREEFLRRVERINRYGRFHGARGFRSGAMYRNAEWYGDLEFSYDMSIPNVAHLEPQRGGCCTVMPYFIGDILELPTTMAQDYTLFHLLGEYSIELWKRQLELILEENGLASFIVHPDYLAPRRAAETYKALLGYLAELRAAGKLWIPLPGEVDTWWRQRSRMRLVCEDGEWRIEGVGSERARVAYAAVEGDTVRYRV